MLTVNICPGCGGNTSELEKFHIEVVNAPVGSRSFRWHNQCWSRKEELDQFHYAYPPLGEVVTMANKSDSPLWACPNWGEYGHDWLDCCDCLMNYEEYLEKEEQPHD